MAAIIAASVVWVLGHDYAPIVSKAVQKLTEEAVFKDGEFQGVPDRIVSESKFLSIAIETEDEGPIDQSADLQIEFRKNIFRVCSLFSSAAGCLEFDYPKDRSLNLNRSKAEPWWGAWQPVILAGAGVVTMLLIGLSWVLLAVLYCPMARLMAWFLDRNLNWSGAWKLSAAALLPGAALMVPAILLYGLRAIDPIGFLFFYAVHFVTGWVYLIGAPFFAPRVTGEKPKDNPFG